MKDLTAVNVKQQQKCFGWILAWGVDPPNTIFFPKPKISLRNFLGGKKKLSGFSATGPRDIGAECMLCHLLK